MQMGNLGICFLLLEVKKTISQLNFTALSTHRDLNPYLQGQQSPSRKPNEEDTYQFRLILTLALSLLKKRELEVCPYPEFVVQSRNSASRMGC